MFVKVFYPSFQLDAKAKAPLAADSYLYYDMSYTIAY
jgi:hypothetical protein